MNEGGIGNRRTVVPRWRPLARTPQHELPSAGEPRIGSSLDRGRVVLAGQRWHEQPTIENAVDLFDAAIVTSDKDQARIAAKWLRQQSEALSAPLDAAIDRLLEPATVDIEPNTGFGTLAIRYQIACLKQRLIAAPRDAVSACELARLYTVNGQSKKAAYWLKRAVSLTPDDRYVLRSAAQFYTHIGAPEEGLELIWRSDAVRYDPWVQAAEVAVADSADRTPKWALRKADLLSPQSAISRSELATGLASFHEKAGAKRRFVRQLLSKGLEKPTENALAQAIWIRAEKGITFEDRRLLQTSDLASEANARQAMEQERYYEALSYFREWIEDEPYSVPALQMAGMCASTFLGEHRVGVDFYQAALRLAPTAPMILNGLLVARAYLGDMDEAQNLYVRLEGYRNEPALEPYVHAAKGLIAFRQGALVAGREAYQEAITSGNNIEGGSLKLTATIFWFEQEILVGGTTGEGFEEAAALLETRLSEFKTLVGSRARKLWRARRAIIRRELEWRDHSLLQEPRTHSGPSLVVLTHAISNQL